MNSRFTIHRYVVKEEMKKMNIDKWTMAFSQNNSNVILCARSNDRCTQNDPVNIEINSRGINYN